jgi:hypothetical protein
VEKIPISYHFKVKIKFIPLFFKSPSIILYYFEKYFFELNIMWFGIYEVCRSVAEANMDEGFCLKAVTRYAVLYDVNLSSSLFSAPYYQLFPKKIDLFVFGFGKRGIKGVNSQSQKLLILLFVDV